jgi:PhnB protein
MKSKSPNQTHFAPQLSLRNVKAGIDYYKAAFGAIELRRWDNPDGSVHVAEMAIDGAMFHLHEENSKSRELSPETVNAVTAIVGIFLPDPDALMNKAMAAGGKAIHPMKDYEYGYRQGTLVDPFGHHWLIQKKI